MTTIDAGTAPRSRFQILRIFLIWGPQRNLQSCDGWRIALTWQFERKEQRGASLRPRLSGGNCALYVAKRHPIARFSEREAHRSIPKIDVYA